MMTPARYPVPPIPDSSVVMAEPLEVTSPAGLAGEGPAVQMSSSGSVVQSSVSPTSPAMSTPEGSPSSKAAAMDQCLPWNGSSFGGGGESADCPLLPAPLTPRWMSSSPQAGESDVAGGHSSMPDLSREGAFDVLQDRPDSGASPQILDGMQGCQYRMTSYDEEHGGPDFTPAYGVQLHDPRLLEYVGAPVGSVAQPQPRILVTPLREREDTCWGGGGRGSVANVLFLYIYIYNIYIYVGVYLWGCTYSTLYLYKVTL